MYSRFRLILLAIGILTVAGLLILLAPKALGFYYQVEGGQRLDSVMNALSDVPDVDVACVELPRERRNQRPEIEEAAALFERALTHDSRNAQAILDQGRAYCLLGDPAAAREYYEIYTDLRPKNPLGHLGLGFANEALGEADLAVKAWQAAGMTTGYFLEAGDQAFQAEHYDSALRWFERATWVGPGDANPWLSLGNAYDQLGQAEQSLEAYQTAWEIDPALSTTALATSLEGANNYPVVERILIQALESFPNSAERLDWWRKLGELLSVQENWDSAESAYQDAIREFPEQPDLHILLGWLYFERGDGLEPAREEMELAITLSEQSGDGYIALGRLLSRVGSYQEADNYLELAIQRSPQNRSYLLARADNTRLAGDLDRAIMQYQEIVNRFPNFGKVYFQLASAYRLSGQSQEAIDTLERGLEVKNPLEDVDFVLAGGIYRWAGLTDEAIRAYRQALVINPANLKAKNSLELLGEE